MADDIRTTPFLTEIKVAEGSDYSIAVDERGILMTVDQVDQPDIAIIRLSAPEAEAMAAALSMAAYQVYMGECP